MDFSLSLGSLSRNKSKRRNLVWKCFEEISWNEELRLDICDPDHFDAYLMIRSAMFLDLGTGYAIS